MQCYGCETTIAQEDPSAHRINTYGKAVRVLDSYRAINLHLVNILTHEESHSVAQVCADCLQRLLQDDKALLYRVTQAVICAMLKQPDSYGLPHFLTSLNPLMYRSGGFLDLTEDLIANKILRKDHCADLNP